MNRPSRPLLQLLRPPNLFTVPGDPLCGALIASQGHWSWRIVPAMIISLAAYCAGLVTNDIADYREDLRDRPTRPLPSGAVSRVAALAIASFFVVLALAASNVVGHPLSLVTAILLAAILFYNILGKRSAATAPVSMGLCRGLSVLIGATAVTSLPPWEMKRYLDALPQSFSFFPTPSPDALYVASFLTISLYIAGVTALARRETDDPAIPALIGRLIRGLLLIQAAFCALAGGCGWLAAILLLALWPVSRIVARRYYAS